MTYPSDDAADKPYGQNPDSSYPSYPPSYPDPSAYTPPPAEYPQQYPPQPSYGPPAGYPAGYPQPGYPVPAGPGTNGLAIASLITGLLSLPLLAICGFGALTGIAAIVLGATGINQINKTQQDGRAMAFIGIGAGILAILGCILWYAFWGFAFMTAPSS